MIQLCINRVGSCADVACCGQRCLICDKVDITVARGVHENTALLRGQIGISVVASSSLYFAEPNVAGRRLDVDIVSRGICLRRNRFGNDRTSRVDREASILDRQATQRDIVSFVEIDITCSAGKQRNGCDVRIKGNTAIC